MSSNIVYTLRHFRRTGPALLETVAWDIFQADNDTDAIAYAQAATAGTFESTHDYVPLWNGSDLIWEKGIRA